MDKRVIFAVAGSGKTAYIIDNLREDSRAVIITYTVNNLRNLKQRILVKFGNIPIGIRVYTYYEFLYSFCLKPILGHKIRPKGINWNIPPSFTFKLKRTDTKFYLDQSMRVYHNRIAKLIEIRGGIQELIQRIEKYFDFLFIDEVQDFGGHDFNLICKFAMSNINILFVGDFYQHTFDTSRDGNVNCNLHVDFAKYRSKFEKSGFTVDTEKLTHSYRCSPNLCRFISQNLDINIDSHRKDETRIEFVNDFERACRIFESDNIVKLFYQACNRYPCYSDNWGAAKGQDFRDICVVLNKNTLYKYREGNLRYLNPQTRNKFYVACTRAKRNLYFIPENILMQYRK